MEAGVLTTEAMGVPLATLVGAEYAVVTVVLGVVAIIARVIALPVLDAEGGKALFGVVIGEACPI